MTQMINRSTALSGLILLMEPRQIKRPHGIAPTRVIANSSKVTRNPFDNANKTVANMVQSYAMSFGMPKVVMPASHYNFRLQHSYITVVIFCDNQSAIDTALPYFSDRAFIVPSAFHCVNSSSSFAVRSDPLRNPTTYSSLDRETLYPRFA